MLVVEIMARYWHDTVLVHLFFRFAAWRGLARVDDDSCIMRRETNSDTLAGVQH